MALLAVLACLCIAGCAEGPQRPNVILISIDCLNQRQFDYAITHGFVPSLSKLKAESLSFSRAYSHAPWTTPSHMSMLTGLYPSQHGRNIPYGFMIEWNAFNDRIPQFPTLPEALSALGYETAAFVGSGSVSAVYGTGQGFHLFTEHPKGRDSSDVVEGMQNTLEWLLGHEDQPFLLFFHTYDLHSPMPVGMTSDVDTMRYIDQQIGRLLMALKTSGRYSSSVIIMTGDHGSRMIETEGKCCVHGAGHYEENIRVPLLVKLPGAPRVREVATLARHVDILPTVLDVVGASDFLYEGPGVSLLRRLEEGRNDDSEVVSFSEADARCARRMAIVSSRYKYIYTPRRPAQELLQNHDRFFDASCPEECRGLPVEELYDLIRDPFERHNLLAGRLKREERISLEWLRTEMERHLNLTPRYRTSVVTGPRTLIEDAEMEELRKSLRTLGYIP